MIDPDISTLDSLPVCGHEECDTLYHPELGYVTACIYTGALLETVTA